MLTNLELLDSHLTNLMALDTDADPLNYTMPDEATQRALDTATWYHWELFARALERYADALADR